MPTNRLRKIIKYAFIPGTPGTAGFPGVPARAAYSFVTTQRFCAYTGAYISEADALAKLQALIGRNNPLQFGGAISYGSNGYSCVDVQTVVNVPYEPGIAPTPGIPATPAQTTEDLQLGWTGRAHSIAVMTGPGRFAFTVPASSVGAVVGLTRAPQASGYGDIEFGFYVARGIARIFESGVEVLNLGQRLNQQLEIRRTKGNIEYRAGGTLVYTRANSSTPYVLGASMYSGGDEVRDPFFEAFGEGGSNGVMRPFTGYANETGVFARSVSVMDPFTGTSSARSRGEAIGVTLPFAGIGGDAYATARGVSLPFTGASESLGAAPTFALALGQTLPFTGQATGINGGIGQGNGVLQRFVGFAGQGAYAAGAGSMLPFASVVYNLTPADEVIAASFAGMTDSIETFTEFFVLVNSSMEITGLIAVDVEYLAEVLSSMTLDDQIALDLEIEALVQSLMRVGSTAADPRLNEASVYSMDIGGSTRYTNYDFNSFAQFDGAHYGAKADGIYLLQGADDAGQAIDARVNLGRPNMGSMNRKALPYVYVGAASNGTLILKVVADGRQYFYRASGDGDEVKTHRFTPGLGLRATNYELEIQNEGGEAFDLAEIEFVPVQLSRRI